MSESLAFEKTINIVFSTEALRQTQYEKNKNIVTFKFITSKKALTGLVFNMTINAISDAEPENLRKIAKSPLTVEEKAQDTQDQTLSDIFEFQPFSPPPVPIISDTDSDITSISQYFTKTE